MLNGRVWLILVAGLLGWEGESPYLSSADKVTASAGSWSMSSMSTGLAPEFIRPNPPVSIMFSLKLFVRTGAGCLQHGGRMYTYVTSRRAQAFEWSLCEEQGSRRHEGTRASSFGNKQQTETLFTASLKVVEVGCVCQLQEKLFPSSSAVCFYS